MKPLSVQIRRAVARWLFVELRAHYVAEEHAIGGRTADAIRFLSVEPLLGPLDVQYSGWKGEWVMEPSPVQWVIVGGESGPRARPFDLTWARSIRAQCQSAGVSLFVKQLGSRPVVDGVPYSLLSGQKLEAHGRDMDEWPEDLRIRTWPR